MMEIRIHILTKNKMPSSWLPEENNGVLVKIVIWKGSCKYLQSSNSCSVQESGTLLKKVGVCSLFVHKQCCTRDTSACYHHLILTETRSRASKVMNWDSTNSNSQVQQYFCLLMLLMFYLQQAKPERVSILPR